MLFNQIVFPQSILYACHLGLICLCRGANAPLQAKTNDYQTDDYPTTQEALCEPLFSA